MFSKKMMIWTALSIFFSLTYKWIYKMLLAIPEWLQRPLLLIVAVIVFFVLRMYMRWGFTEEKLIEKIAQNTDKEFAPKKVTTDSSDKSD